MILGLDAWIFWLILMVLFLAVEAATAGLVSIWFAAGSLVALLAAAFGAGLWVQVPLAIVVSLATLVVFIRLRHDRSFAHSATVPTNADRWIDAEAVVIEAVDPIRGTGQVKAMGQVWSAVSQDGKPVPVDAAVRIVEIRGVRAVIVPMEPPAPGG